MPERPYNQKLSLATQQEIRQLYEAGYGSTTLAKRYNVDPKTIRRYLHNRGVAMRKGYPLYPKERVDAIMELMGKKATRSGYIARALGLSTKQTLGTLRHMEKRGMVKCLTPGKGRWLVWVCNTQ